MKKLLSLILCIILCCQTVFAGQDAARAAVEEYISRLDISGVRPGYLNGEWNILACARSGAKLQTGWYEDYYSALCALLEENNGILNERKYTEYSRTVIALTAIGKDPRNAGGHNLLEKLADIEAVKKQGLNGSIYALIALDCGGYEIPRCQSGKTQATRAAYLEEILSAQNSDGSFSLSGGGDSDVTAMALQALSKYTDNEKVKTAVDRALVWLSENQTADGGFASGGAENCESAAQVLTALGELGIDPDTDARFIKNGKTIVDNILSCRYKNGFRHLPNQTVTDQMATEQAVYALVSYLRRCDGETSLYDMRPEKEDIVKKINEWAMKYKEYKAA